MPAPDQSGDDQRRGGDRALALDANSTFAWRLSAWVNCFAGNYEQSI